MLRVSGLECSGGQLFSSSHCLQRCQPHSGPLTLRLLAEAGALGPQQQPPLLSSLSHPLSHLPWYLNGHRYNVLFFQGYFKHTSSFLLVFNSSFQIECYLYPLPIVVKSYLISFILPLSFQFVTLQFSLFCSF